MKFDFSEAAASVQAMITGFIERLPYLIVALIVFIIFYVLAIGARKLIHSFSKQHRRHYNLSLVMGRLSFGALLLIGLLIALVIAIPGFTPGQLVGILGLSSVAIGFAFRDILQNFLAGILLLLTEPFRIGDQIVVDNFEGTVENIQTRATFIRTYDGRRVVIPNSTIFTKSIIVNTANDKRRLEYDFGIGFSDDVAQAKRIMLETIKLIPDVLQDPPPDALVVTLTDSSISVRLRWWMVPPRRSDVMASQDQVLEAVVKALLAEGIDLPFPTQQILFHDQTEESDGDRSRQREGWPKGKDTAPRPARIVDALRELQKRRDSAGQQEDG